MIKLMVRGDIPILMELFMMEIGIKISRKDMELSIGLMEHIMRAILKMEAKKVKECYNL